MTDKTAIQPEQYWRHQIAGEIEVRIKPGCDCDECRVLRTAADVAKGHL